MLNKKRILSFFLAVVMVLSMLPTQAFASEEAEFHSDTVIEIHDDEVNEKVEEPVQNDENTPPVTFDIATVTTAEALSSIASRPTLDIVRELAHTLSTSNEFIDATDDWRVMEMVAYGKKSALTQPDVFATKAITTANATNRVATDYERVAISLTSMGYDITNLDLGDGEKRNLLEKISNYNKTSATPSLGTVNAYIWALLAYDGGQYPLPIDAYWTREKVVNDLLQKRKADGGWALSGSVSDPDMTAMAISSLLPYQNRADVVQAINEAVSWASSHYQQNNGFKSWGVLNSNSASMMIVALSGLGIDADTDTRFVKDGNSLLQHLLSFKTADGRFGYKSTTYDGFATEQAFRALVSYKNLKEQNQPYNIYAFEKTVVLDKTHLQAKITEAEVKNTTDYTPQSVEELKAQLQNAKTILDNINVTQDEIDEATTALTNALSDLARKSTLDIAMELVSTLSTSVDFTSATDDWRVMEMVAYGKKSTLTQPDVFVTKAIATANATNRVATDYERVAISLTSMGYDITNLDLGDGKSLNLLGKISGYNKTSTNPSLGTVNAYIWALLAYDGGQYTLPKDAYWTREKVVNDLLQKRKADGGWALSGSVSDPDMTAMAISSLLPYQNRADVAQAINEAVAWLSTHYQQNNGFKSWGVLNSNSASMVIVALSGLGIDADTDTRFVKDGHSLLENLFSFRTPDGRFGYKNNNYDGFATEQAFRALVSYTKLKEQNKPYNIYAFDKIITPTPTPTSKELPEKISITDVNQKVEGYILSDKESNLSVTTTSNGATKTATLPQITATKLTTNKDKQASIEIQKQTIVTASSDWDGKIGLPKVVTPTLSEKTVAFAIQVGADVDLTFDQPVRLVMPNALNQKVGFIDSTGAFTEITTTLETDSATALKNHTEGKYVSGNDIVIWTTHFTTFALYSDIEADTKGGGNNKDNENITNPENTDITVKVSVTGDAKMGTLFRHYAVTVPTKSVAWVAIKKALEENGIKDYDIGYDDNYIRGIKGLYEFTNGPYSGWLYYINGSLPNIGVGQYRLNNGDTIELKYTDDYTKDTPLPDNPAENGNASNPFGDDPIFNGIDLKKGLDRINNKTTWSDWEAFVLAVNGYPLKDRYTTKLLQDFTDKKGELRLATDYARLALVLKASGKSITSFGGYNILDQIVNNPDLGKQGVNGYIFSLIILSNETIPQNSLWTREKLIDQILVYQKADGGFSLSLTGVSDVDITAMALTAFAPYKNESRVKTAIDKAIAYLKSTQDADGHFSSYNEKNSESTAQVIIALSALGIDIKSGDFTKGDKNPMDILALFKHSDESFGHLLNGESNGMATEQALMAITAYRLYKEGKGSLYSFTASESLDTTAKINTDIQPETATAPTTKKPANPFIDVKENDWFYNGVLSAYEHHLFSGTTKEYFSPQASMTRGMFVTVLARLDGANLTTYNTSPYTDVDMKDWYGTSVAWATDKGIATGVRADQFAPNKEITREEMATMLFHYLQYKDIQLDKTADTSPFADHNSISPWARLAVEDMKRSGLVGGVGNNAFDPKGTATRAQVAQIFATLLTKMQP